MVQVMAMKTTSPEDLVSAEAASVHVVGQGPVQMKGLKVGDKVQFTLGLGCQHVCIMIGILCNSNSVPAVTFKGLSH